MLGSNQSECDAAFIYNARVIQVFENEYIEQNSDCLFVCYNLMQLNPLPPPTHTQPQPPPTHPAKPLSGSSPLTGAHSEKIGGRRVFLLLDV